MERPISTDILLIQQTIHIGERVNNVVYVMHVIVQLHLGLYLYELECLLKDMQVYVSTSESMM